MHPPVLFADFPGIDGFLGTRGSLMLDIVFLAMFAIVPMMFWSIYQVRYRKKYTLHKWTQITLGTVLLVTVLAFEIDMRLNGWRERAIPSPFWKDGPWNDRIDFSLAVHLFFAIPTLVIWLAVIIHALRRFPVPPQPSQASKRHVFWARIAALEMTCTAVTGWVFYYLAFFAS